MTEGHRRSSMLLGSSFGRRIVVGIAGAHGLRPLPAASQAARRLPALVLYRNGFSARSYSPATGRAGKVRSRCDCVAKLFLHHRSRNFRTV